MEAGFICKTCDVEYDRRTV